jgi:tannase/feruloyl esterase
MSKSLRMAILVLCIAAGRPMTVTADEPDACKSLERADFSGVKDAPTQIIEARAVGPDERLPGYCEVTGYAAPSVGFMIRLPATWNGKFVELGCGGYCGSFAYIGSCNLPLRRGYACAVSDGGHRSSGGDGKWAYNNLQTEIDYGFRATHVTAVAAKAIVSQYYGAHPGKSYFIGFSSGGRQALMQVQRFPWDFDGVIAGSPAMHPQVPMNLLWGNRILLGDGNTTLISQADLHLLHTAVVAKCDLNDGIKDGLIGDPRSCLFDPADLVCLGTKEAGCLTREQVSAVRKIYEGPTTSAGARIQPAGAMRGSERTWLDWFVDLFRPGSRFTSTLLREWVRYMAFDPDPGPAGRVEDFDFDVDFRRLGFTEVLYLPDNPDLRRFRAAGGKLIMYAGWNDAGGMVLPVAEYYEAVERAMGGRGKTQEFARLFLIPGMGHGPTRVDGAFVVDWLAYLEAWVEKGVAPDRVVASHVRLDDLVSFENTTRLREQLRRLDIPLDAANVSFTRPVYPYPTTTRYLGRGEPTSATSFGPDSK